MAEIERRVAGKRVTWRVRWYENEERRSRTCPDKATAQAVQREVERQLASRGYVRFDPPPKAPPLHLALDAFLTARGAGLRPRSVVHYEDGAVLLLRYLAGWPDPSPPSKKNPDPRKPDTGRVLLTAFRDGTIPGFYSWLLDAGRSPSTATKRAGTVRLWWEWVAAHSEYRNWIPPAPHRLDIRRPPRRPPIAPTWPEVDACLAALAESPTWLQRFALVARYTGLRRSEILLLDWNDVDLDTGTLTVRDEAAKGGRGWTAPLCPHLVQELSGWGLRTGLLVGAPDLEVRSAAADGRGHVDRNLRRAWRRAGVPTERWKGQPCHAFRKCLETELVRAGARWDAVEAFVGHRLPGTGGAHYVDVRRALWDAMVDAAGKIPRVGAAGIFLPSDRPVAPLRPHEENGEVSDSASNAVSLAPWRRAMGIEPTGQRLPTRPDRF